MQAVVNKWVCGINKQIRLNAVSSWPLCISLAKSFLSCLAIACLLFLSSLSRHRACLIAFLLQISKAKTKTKGLHKLELVHAWLSNNIILSFDKFSYHLEELWTNRTISLVITYIFSSTVYLRTYILPLAIYIYQGCK